MSSQHEWILVLIVIVNLILWTRKILNDMPDWKWTRRAFYAKCRILKLKVKYNFGTVITTLLT
jgi:hypothetical protein